MLSKLSKFFRSSTMLKRPHIRFLANNSDSCDGEPRPFEDIPGPRSLPIIGTLYKYLVLVGEYKFFKLHDSGKKKLKRYGPLVREEIIPGVQIVWVFRPEDIAKIFKAEVGLHPKRRSHLALLKYRMDRRDVYNTGGLLPTNGIEWWRIRREFQKSLSKPSNIVTYLEDVDRIVQEFLPLCTQEDDFLPLLSRLYLEIMCLAAFDVRMNSLSKEEMAEGSVTTNLIHAAMVTNSAILKLDNGPRLWRFFETPLYRKMRKAQNYMEKVTIEMVDRKARNTAINKRESFLGAYLKNPALDMKDIVGMASDMLLAGIDTTTYSTAFALYHLARNPESQEKLRMESIKLLPNSKDPVTAKTLKNASYTKAVLKETFRLNPISVGIGRILQTDVVLSGYHIPKGTVVVTQNEVACRLPEYFEDPNKFLPDRWLRDDDNKNLNVERSVHPYLLLPFGHGPRSCIARRFAEQNMQTLLIRICRELRFDWNGRDLGSSSLLVNKPDGPIKLRFYKDPKNL